MNMVGGEYDIKCEKCGMTFNESLVPQEVNLRFAEEIKKILLRQRRRMNDD